MIQPRGRVLKQPSRLSYVADIEGTQDGGSNWDQELLKLQIASSALINPLGNTESAAIADPRILAEVTHQKDVQLADAAAQALAASQTSTAGREWRQETAGPAGNSNDGVPCANARSFASPFFAAAQHFCSPNASPPQEKPSQASPAALATALSADSEYPVHAGLALQRQTETAEIIIPQASLDCFGSLNTSPTLPEHPLATTPLSPQNTAKGFVTADSFKHEPGHTLLDCTDPTPNHSLDLDDQGLKNRLAQLLPKLPLPGKKGVKRNLSSQLFGLESLTEGANEGPGSVTALQQSPVPGPAFAGLQEEGALEAKALRHHWNFRRMSETGLVGDKDSSQTCTGVLHK